jgi:radical SAM PhpK family P-methyltransferase
MSSVPSRRPVSADVDCLLVGYNAASFGDYVAKVASMGLGSGAYRDLRLYYTTVEGQPIQCMDALNDALAPRVDERLRDVPLNNQDFLSPAIAHLGTHLRRWGECSFDYVNQFQLDRDVLREKLVGQRNRLVAITTTFYVDPDPIIEVVRFVREHDEEVPIVVGGPFMNTRMTTLDEPTLLYLFDFLGADVYVNSGDGDQALLNVVQVLKSGGDLRTVKNIAFRDEGSWTITAIDPEFNELETNMVDWSLFSDREIGELVSLRTAKSCPFACKFCTYPERQGVYRYLPVELVEEELDVLRERGVTTLTFIDDTFNVPKQRFKELLRMMIRKQYGFRWNSFYRSDVGDRETIELMREAGCEGVFLGWESGSDAILKLMNKTARANRYLQAVADLREVGITTHGSFIVGFPGETAETVEETLAFLDEARPDFFRANLWFCDPMSPIYRERETHGIEGSSYAWRHRTMTSEEASDHIDRLFMTVDSSVWLPPRDFEFWSIFYLQRKGMTLGEIKAFLRAWNAVVRDNVATGTSEAPPSLYEELRLTCASDELVETARRRVAANSAGEPAPAGVTR